MRNSKKYLFVNGSIVCMAIFINFNTCINYELNEVLAWIFDNAILGNIELQYYLFNAVHMELFYIRIVLHESFSSGCFLLFYIKEHLALEE